MQAHLNDLNEFKARASETQNTDVDTSESKQL